MSASKQSRQDPADTHHHHRSQQQQLGANHSLNSINCLQSHLILHWRHLADTHSLRLTASAAEQEA